MEAYKETQNQRVSSAAKLSKRCRPAAWICWSPSGTPWTGVLVTSSQNRPRRPRRIAEPWRLNMKDRLQQNPEKTLYALRKQTVEPVFGIIKSAMGFSRFHLCGGLINAVASVAQFTMAKPNPTVC